MKEKNEIGTSVFPKPTIIHTMHAVYTLIQYNNGFLKDNKITTNYYNT